ncbi:MAG TPA: hypothetical protein V6C65_20545 [Allocoleopsis sp.]
MKLTHDLGLQEAIVSIALTESFLGSYPAATNASLLSNLSN